MIQSLLIKKEQMKTSRWSGGTTTQIDLFPDGTTYGARDFTFRVSSATIEETPSQFTALPDYQRWITMLSGPVVLEHGLERGLEDGRELASEDVDRHKLQPLQVHCFDGGTPTTSLGEARDFNLMLRKGFVGNMMTLSIGPQTDLQWIGQWLTDRSTETQGHLAVYWPEDRLVSEGSEAADQAVLRVVFENNTVLLNRGDYLRLSGAVKALNEVQMALEIESDLLVLYMET